MTSDGIIAEPPGATLVLGTRGSDLALAQTLMVRSALARSVPARTVTHEVIRTLGDVRQDIRLSQAGASIGPDGHPLDKGIFTRELEVALRDGAIHAAVHSLKDVPTELDPGFEIVAVLPRAAVEDVLIFRSPADAGGGPAGDRDVGGTLPELRPGAVVATSSVRRRAQLLALRPDLTIVEIRGNVPTRLRKLRDDLEIDALMLARAGLDRLGFLAPVASGSNAAAAGESALVPLRAIDHEFGALVLEASRFLPAASQGAVGLEVYRAPAWVRDAMDAINDPATFVRVRAERRFLHRLGAGCQTPVGVLTSVNSDGALRLEAAVFEDDGGVKRCDVMGESADPEGTADAAAAALA